MRPTRSTCCGSGRSPDATAWATAKADYAHKHYRHGVNVQVVTDPIGQTLGIPPALPGRCHDLTAARAHRIFRICERRGVPILDDRAHAGAGPWVTTGRRPTQRPGRLTSTERTANRALATPRAPSNAVWHGPSPGESSRRWRCGPNRMTPIAKGVLTVERQRCKRSLDQVGVRMFGGGRADVDLHVVGAADFDLGRLRRALAAAVPGGDGGGLFFTRRPAVSLAPVPFE